MQIANIRGQDYRLTHPSSAHLKMMKRLICFSSFLFSSACSFNTFNPNGPQPPIYIKLGELLEASNPISANYVLGDGECNKDFAEQQLAMHRCGQWELKGFFDDLLPTIKDPVEYCLIRKDMQRLICRNPLENTAYQISERGNKIIRYRSGYKERLQEIAVKEKIK